MRWFRFAVLILLAAVLQASLFADLNVKPDLLSILLVFFAIYCNIPEAIITSFTIGFAADLIGPAMGPQMVSYGLFGTALAYLHRVIAIKKMPHQALAIFITALLADAVANFLASLKGQPIAPNILTVLLGISLYSSVVGPFLFLPFGWWTHIKTSRIQRKAAYSR